MAWGNVAMRTPQDDRTLEIYRRAGFTGRVGFGKRPAVCVVDFQLGFTDPSQSPLAGDFSQPIEAARQVLAAARSSGVPVFFTVIGYQKDLRDAGLWVQKVPSLAVLQLGSPLTEVDPRLERRPDEVVIVKKYASAFAGTPLHSLLAAQGVDTLILMGCTTSGCVRASGVDALQFGFRPLVVVDACADRAQGPHEANLFDLGSKYADLISSAEAVEYLRGLSHG